MRYSKRQCSNGGHTRAAQVSAARYFERQKEIESLKVTHGKLIQLCGDFRDGQHVLYFEDEPEKTFPDNFGKKPKPVKFADGFILN